jgi:hypothetical protein
LLLAAACVPTLALPVEQTPQPSLNIVDGTEEPSAWQALASDGDSVASPNAFVRALAKDARRGCYPRAFLDEQSYWTIVGTDADSEESLLSEDGALEVRKGGFSIEPFIRIRDATLTWADVDLVAARLTVRGESAKSGRTRHVPLNTEAVQVLTDWQKQASADLVFPDEEGERMFSLKTAWSAITTAAALEAFRFHDLRHSFASKLVQRRVDLATVRELLGHSDFALTLRYAHLAPENKAAAVARLVG